VSTLTRRQFLGHSAALNAVVVAGPTVFVACSDDKASKGDKGPAQTPGTLGTAASVC
jgi:hypothetical protein